MGLLKSRFMENISPDRKMVQRGTFAHGWALDQSRMGYRANCPQITQGDKEQVVLSQSIGAIPYCRPFLRLVQDEDLSMNLRC